MTALADIGGRLRTERERIGKTQADMGAVAGVTRQTQSNYESGDRAPDVAYLAAISEVGVDVQYVVTGKRQVPAATPTVHEARQPQKPYEAQSQRQEQQAPPVVRDDLPEQPKGPVISLDLMQRVVGLVDMLRKKRGAVLERKVEIEMIVRIYNYLVEDDEDEGAVEDRKIERVVRLVVNG